VTENTAKETIVVPYNNQQAVEKVFTEYGSEIAGVILEPVTGNMGVIAPEPGYLDFLRKITRKNGALLIFDEVMTGFRLARGGAGNCRCRNAWLRNRKCGNSNSFDKLD
jgi:glutamate-1-semialdehyde 2,1-aminomutase